MKLISKTLLGFTAIAFVACSSDEPAVNPVTPETPDGEVAYMTVRLNDATSNTRSVTDGGTINGSEAEHKVNNALFLFFDESGAYVGKATPWNGGKDNVKPGDTNQNVEFISETVVVLDNLTGTNYPSYVMTVLNAPGFEAESTMDLTAKKLQNWYNTIGVNEDYFVMSTTSYYVNENNNKRHNDDYYYATRVTSDDFTNEPNPTEESKKKVVDIYVERLAAKAQVLTGESLTAATNGLYKIDATVAGNDNPNDDDANIGKTDIYVRIDGWALSNTLNNSYISKNLDGWNAGSTIFDKWNDKDNYRSYWGKSIAYGGWDENNVTRKSWIQLKNTVNTGADYCNENTMTSYEKVPSQATSYLIAATACDAEGNGLDLVRYNGLLFKNEAFFSYILNAANATGNLNYWIKKTTTTEVKDENGEVQKDENGNNVVNSTYTYRQLGADEIKLGLEAVKGTADKANAVVTSVSFTLNEGEELVKKSDSGEYVTLTGETTETIKTALNAYLSEKFSKVEAYKGGKMYYTVPVEHNAALKTLENASTSDEGYYGVVRNHWYQLTVNKIEKIGHGVFSPGSDTEDDPGEPIIPEDPEEFFYLSARINILSWKIINQSVDL